MRTHRSENRLLYWILIAIAATLILVPGLGDASREGVLNLHVTVATPAPASPEN